MKTVDSAPQVLVLGAGLIGLACARELARRGLRVDVVDAAASGAASPASAGLLAPVTEGADRVALARICADAARAWPEWAVRLEEETGLGIDFETCGSLTPVLDPAHQAHVDGLRATAELLGEPFETVSGATLRREVPELSPAVDSALLLPTEARVDPRAVLAALERSLAARSVPVHRPRAIHRVHPVRQGVRVEGTGWATTVPSVVVATGSWTARIEGLQDLPVRPVKGQMVAYGALPWSWRGTLRSPSCYTLFRSDGRLLVGATEENAGFDVSTSEAARVELTAAAQRYFPSLGLCEVIEQWAGLRPASGDGLPILGYRAGTEILLAAGHHRNGVLLAPWTAARVADAVLGAAAPPAPLSPERFFEGGATALR
ncbi:MAG TPA: glycine oxidase ThiO [Thermoanaerobaculia bacterium]|nr:glycine oxidase ThiO [Thermoanaerobaculia bacterium]